MMSTDLSSAGMFVPHQTVSSIRCCICGSATPLNPANMCATCLRSNTDITAGLPRHAALVHCPDCKSWLQPPHTWVRADLETKELLAHCLRRLKPRTKSVRVVNAEFEWTEPHSKRIKLILTVQAESIHGAILQVKHAVEFVQHDRLCENCSRAQASPDQWVAAVQLRQHVAHRRTFLFLEQLILRHGAAARAIRIKEAERGLDFFFGHRSHALKFVEFVNAVAPVKHRSDKQLVSHDPKSNVYNYKHTFSVEICPICREDLICLPPKVANSLGNLGPVVICTKVSNNIQLLDPLTLRTVYLDSNQYWREPFKPMLTSRQLIRYIVLDLEKESYGNDQYHQVYATIARESDFGVNDESFTVKTHLGHLLKEGDFVLGYDLYSANFNDSSMDKYRGRLDLPYAILIKKCYEDRRSGKPRKWKLKRLEMEVDNAGRGKADEETRNLEYEKFLRDLEENPELTMNISLYRNNERQQSEMASDVGDDDHQLDELFEVLNLNDESKEENSMAE